jgi:hypothetical protein
VTGVRGIELLLLVVFVALVVLWIGVLVRR